MRIKHTALQETKNILCVRLAYLLDMLGKELTNKSMALALKVSPTVISRIRRGRWAEVSLDYVMVVADNLEVDYSITVARRKGQTTVKVVGIESAVGIKHSVTRIQKNVTIRRVN